MSELNPNAPPGFEWCFLEIDIPVCRDFIKLQEKIDGAVMTHAAAVEYVMKEFSFTRFRAKQIVDTILGEPV